MAEAPNYPDMLPEEPWLWEKEYARTCMRAPSMMFRSLLDITPLGEVKSETEQLRLLAIGMMISGAVSLLVTSLPGMRPGFYGRYTAEASLAWGVKVNANLAWFIQESPNLLMAVSNVFMSDKDCLESSVNQILLGLFAMHYLNRALVYPLLIRRGTPFPVGTVILAMLFCTINGYMQSRVLTRLAVYDEAWFLNPRFGAGVSLFLAGMLINMQADATLRFLRPSHPVNPRVHPEDGKGEYKIPRGGGFRFVSCPNYLGEILEWAGFALATGFAIHATAFLVFTASILIPRAVHHHRWYKSRFPNYPPHRKAVLPFIL